MKPVLYNITRCILPWSLYCAYPPMYTTLNPELHISPVVYYLEACTVHTTNHAFYTTLKPVLYISPVVYYLKACTQYYSGKPQNKKSSSLNGRAINFFFHFFKFKGTLTDRLFPLFWYWTNCVKTFEIFGSVLYNIPHCTYTTLNIQQNAGYMI